MIKFTTDIPTKVGTYLTYGDPSYKPGHEYFSPRWGIVKVSLSGNGALVYIGYGSLCIEPNTKRYGLLKFCPIEDVSEVPSLEE